MPTRFARSGYGEDIPLETVGFEGLDRLAAEYRQRVVVPDRGRMLLLGGGAVSAGLARSFPGRVATMRLYGEP